MSSAPRAGALTVVILAGGFGTRLGDLTRDRPKPMIEIANTPYLEFVVESFTMRGLTDFVFLTGYRGEVIERHFGDGSAFGAHVAYSHEREPLGTGGAVREARRLIANRFILTYADVLRRFDYDRFVTQHGGNCLAVYPRRTDGNTDVANGLVTRFDKSVKDLPFVDAGFAVLRNDVIDLLPGRGACSFEQQVYPALAAKANLEAEIVDYDFYDIGTPDELARTRAALEAL